MEGYDAKFDPPLDKRLECPICLLAQRDPMQTPCGHRFCSPCILRALRETGPRCPVDNTRISHHQLFKDNFARREVLSLNVCCSANDCGCTWHGELRDLELHSKNCELVIIECPHTCSFSCQRKDLSSHIFICPNKPQQCPTCSVFFPKNKRVDHAPYCSKIMLPESVQSTLFKANEVLKWCGHLKLKINSQPVQVIGYLSVKVESEESFMFTGNWFSTLNLISLNSGEARIFWRILHSTEVQPQLFNFTVHSNDVKSITFLKMLRRKTDNMNAVVCLRLKPVQSHHSFTIIYIHWNDQRKRLMACVAELKSHLIRQLQSRLQVLRSSRIRRNPTIVGARMARVVHTHPHAAHSNPHHQHHPTHPHPPHPHPTHPHTHGRAPPPPPPPGSMQRRQFPSHALTHPHIHPGLHSHPHAPSITVVNTPSPQQVPMQATQVVTASGPRILPNLLSWQMSQSLNTFPWRVQAAGVPFFTFPSTPPQFLPANSYPYTFAPVPAAPFSISPMQHVPGITVPQVAGDPTATPPGPSFAVAAAVPAPVGEGDQLPTVAMTIAGAITAHPDVSGNPLPLNVNVIQQPSSARMGLNSSAIHGQLQAGHHHVQPAIVQPMNTGRLHPSQVIAADQEEGRFFGPVTRQVVPPPPPPPPPPIPHHPVLQPHVATSHGLHDHSRGTEIHIISRSIPLLSTSSIENSPSTDSAPSSSSPFPSTQRRDLASVWDDSPGPSHHSNLYLRPPSDSSDSEEDSSPLQAQLGSLSPLRSLSPLTSDSDTPNTPLLDSPTPFGQSSGNSPESSSTLSSDQEGVSMSHSDNESVGNSALHTLANAAAILADSPTPLDSGEPEPSTPQRPNTSSGGEPLRLPVLINLSDSDSESQIATPPSVIDLTSSPLSISPHSNNTSHSGTHLNQREVSQRSERSIHVSSAVPVLVPVIHGRHISNPGGITNASAHLDLSRHPNVAPYVAEAGAVAMPHPHLQHPHVAGIQPANLTGQPQHPFQPEFAGTTVPVLGWPYEQPPMEPHLVPPQQMMHGGFWETVMPSLDISLQNSNEPRSSRN